MSVKKVLISGNEAIAKGAIEAGCVFYAGYPITPQNELTAYLARHLPDLNRVFIQAESEVAAVNMVFGAAAAGARAMTSSSGPGMSLKQEGISYIAGAELPAVIVNVMRGGPGLGNIAPSQSDYFQATRPGHGDYHSIVLAPSSAQEAYDMMPLAFDLADKYRTPVMILCDGMFGQMMEPILAQEAGGRRQNTKIAPKPWALTGCKGRAPNVIKSFYLGEGGLEELNIKLQKKYEAIRSNEQLWEETFLEDAESIIVAYGTMARVGLGVVNRLREKGVKAGLIRPKTLWPFPEKAFKKIPDKKGLCFLVVEMSYGQMAEDVRLTLNGRFSVNFLGRAGGGIPSEKEIIRKLNIKNQISGAHIKNYG